MPAAATPVVVLRPGERSGASGRALSTIGDSLQVKLDGSNEKTSAPLGAIYVRVGEPTPSAKPSGLRVGARALVERLPGESATAQVVKLEAGVAHVRFEDGVTEVADLTRVTLPRPPTSKAADVPPAVPPTPPDATEGTETLQRRVHELWHGGHGGYRETPRGRIGALEVERGSLSLEISRDGARFVVSIVASTEGPPLDAVSVRLARWLRATFGGADAIAAADATWLAALAIDGPTGVSRAGGALALTVRASEAPDAGAVVRWARAVHTRLLSP